MGPPPFDRWKVMRGQTRGKASYFSKTVQSTMTNTCIFKDVIRIKEKHELSSEGDKEFK